MPTSRIASRPRRLPSAATTFIGRRADRLRLRRLLAASRLVTIVGPGGTGKTRLALRAAAEDLPRDVDDVVLVELAAVADPSLVTGAVVAALGIRDDSASWTLGTLARYLEDRAVLLVLDNCEHVRDGAALLAAALLRSCPDARILATSREALHVDGEAVMPLQPLELPAGDVVEPSVLLRSDAVALFVERASGPGGTFVLGPSTAADVAAICRELDGLPLAIELAAARVPVVGLAALRDNLHEHVAAVTRSGQPRGDIASTIDWSYQLLAEDERLLWSRLSVFVGGFELDAATEVCGAPPLRRDRVALLVASLVERSLVTRPSEDGARFTMLEVLRRFAAARLVESGRGLRTAQPARGVAGRRIAGRLDEPRGTGQAVRPHPGQPGQPARGTGVLAVGGRRCCAGCRAGAQPLGVLADGAPGHRNARGHRPHRRDDAGGECRASVGPVGLGLPDRDPARHAIHRRARVGRSGDRPSAAGSRDRGVGAGWRDDRRPPRATAG